MQLGVHNQLQRAHTYLGLPMHVCALHKLVSSRGGCPQRPADALPDRLVQFVERVAAGGMWNAVGTFYARMFALMIAMRARAQDMASAKNYAVVTLLSHVCITCAMDMKDGSKGAWCGVPARGVESRC